MFSNDFAQNYKESDIENVFNKAFNQFTISDEDYNKMKVFFTNTAPIKFTSAKMYNKFIVSERRRLKFKTFSKIEMRKIYKSLLSDKLIIRNKSMEQFMKLKMPRGWSGVSVITVFTSGNQMGRNADESVIKKGGCPMDCFYCPFEKDENGIATQPRSYLSTEPGNMRATENKHHPVGQAYDRLHQLELMGHISANPDLPNKCEFIISGGTFNFYPKDYIEWFVTCLYYACNTYNTWNKRRDMLTLEEEQIENEESSIRMIGLTIETRPDYVAPKDKKNPNKINLDEIEFFRKLGVTRVQIGFQHTDDYILKKVNRQCTLAQNKEGLRILKQNGIKSDIHIMFDLPYSSPEKDIKCVDQIVDDPDLQADQWKLYPTETTPWTRIKQWRDEGKYTPYAEDNSEGVAYKLVPVLVHTLGRTPRFIRVNRVVRDIPAKSIEGGLKCGNLRQIVDQKMKDKGILCSDIREREIKMKSFDSGDIQLFVQKYEGSGGTEYFISYETCDMRNLYGFIRLRLNRTWYDTLPYLHGHALVRELHVYGVQQEIDSEDNSNLTQHKGIGGKLLKYAEELAWREGYRNISVISGVGVKPYYRKKGYRNYCTYMSKKLNKMCFSELIINDICFLLGLICLVISMLCVMQI
jgi:ELP3 family radical SAM enzyme/protein acetyltransferase